jgi:hypothetical protein
VTTICLSVLFFLTSIAILKEIVAMPSISAACLFHHGQ